MKNRPILAMAAILVLAALACGPLASSTEDVFDEIESELEAGSTTGDDTVSEPGAQSIEDAPPFEYTGLDYESFDSYEIDIAITYTALDGSGNFDLQISLGEQQEPRTAQFLIEVTGEGGGETFDLGLEGDSGRIGLYEVDDTTYVEFSDSSSEPFCIGSPTDPEEETEAPVEDFIGDGGAFDLSDVDADFEIVEAGVTVNGQVTNHYRATNFQDQDLTEAVADVYVSQGDGNIVRLVVEGVGSLDDEASEGDVLLSYDLLSVNEPITVEVPDYCETFEIPTDDTGGETDG